MTFFKGKHFLTEVQGSRSLVTPQSSTGHVSSGQFWQIPTPSACLLKKNETVGSLVLCEASPSHWIKFLDRFGSHTFLLAFFFQYEFKITYSYTDKRCWHAALSQILIFCLLITSQFKKPVRQSNSDTIRHTIWYHTLNCHRRHWKNSASKKLWRKRTTWKHFAKGL